MADTDIRPGETRLEDLIAGPATRTLVPTDRERALLPDRAPDRAAVGAPDGAPDGDLSRERRRWFRRTTKEYARSLDLRGTRAPKVPLIVFALSAVFAGWDAQVIGLVGPEIRTEFGVSIAALVTLGSVLGILGTLAALPMGYVVDRVKRVWLIRLGGILGQVSVVMQAVATSFFGLIGSRCVGFLGNTLSGPASAPLTADYFAPQLRGRVFAFLGACGRIGTLLSIPLVGWLITEYGWRQAVLALAVPGFLFALLAFFLREPTRGEVDRKYAGLDAELSKEEPPPLSAAASLRGAWSIRSLRRQAFAGLVSGIAAGPVFLITGLFLADRFLLSPAERAWILWVEALVTAPALLLAGPVADRIMARKPSMLVLIQAGIMMVGAASLVVMVLAPSVAYVVVLQVVLGFAAATVAPAMGVLYSRLVPAQFRGLGMQIFAPFAVVGLVLAPILTGYAESSWGAGGALVAFAPFFVVAALMFASSASSVARDIRAADLANIADQAVQAAKEAGRNKMVVARGVEVEYGGVQVLFGVDLDIEDGETIALLGTNGAGKSTLMRALCGLHQASNGAIYLDGLEVTHTPAHELARRGIVVMPGGQAVFPQLSVAENLRTAAWTFRADATEVAERTERVFGFFPVLRERLQQRAGTLSGGEQQMVAMAQALLMRPRLLMIDELSLGLAPAVVDQLLGIVREIKAQGTTIVLVEQSLNIALTVAERAVFMDKGEVRFDGSTQELLGRPDLVRAVFMGTASAGSSRTRGRGPAERTTVLRAEGIEASFGGIRALRDASLEVAAGEVVGIIGPNGAGKTTLFDVLSGHVRPDAGTVLLYDGDSSRDVTRLSPDARARHGLGRSFQSALLFGSLTVRETIAVAHERRAVRSAVLGAVWAPNVRRSERRIRERVDGLIDLLGLGAYADKFVRELSTGTRRAVEIGCVMAAEPKVLLLDEPSSGLAQAESEALGPALARIVHDTGCGLLLVEHDLPLVMAVSDRLVAMDLGRVIADGPPDEVTRDPQVVEAYLSASADALQRSGAGVASALAEAVHAQTPSEGK
ncbi:MFS transporter [Actinopolymorpha sp. B9G3]|uniref:MFS transporter n=1 Tax=Actinopolymorpha sp. B9G3 TaxID=3158970 RepID=UPI0032D90180